MVGITKPRNFVISIYAPLTGRNPVRWEYQTSWKYFNICVPCGTNPILEDMTWMEGFQYTRPLWGATTYGSGDGRTTLFQSMRPV